MLTPYPIHRNTDGSINFTTDEGITYKAAFVDASYHFGGVTGVYEFNLYPDGQASEKPDSRIGLTVIYILEIFFQQPENVLLYICESLDGRQFARKRKFDNWFRQEGTAAFLKYDYKLQVQDVSILITLILSNHNPHQQRLVDAFRETYDLYDSMK